LGQDVPDETEKRKRIAMEDVAEGKPDFALVWFCVALVDVLTSLTDAGVVAGE